MINRDVFYIRLNNMELQTERLMDPSLKTRSVAIISSHHPSGSIISLSSEAKEEGLCRGMKVSVVRKMSHGTQLLPYNQLLYNRINQYIYRIVSLFTPVVEPYGLNGFFLDMCGMRAIYGNMKNTGHSIMKRIQEQVNIFGTTGISENKLVSRIITSVVPDLIHKVDNGYEAQFLAPLKPLLLPTAKTNSIQRILRFLLIKQISDIQSMAKQSEEFNILFGIYALALSEESKGYDPSPVTPPLFRNHILEQRILPEDTNDETILHAVVRDLADQLSFKLRKSRQIADTVRLEIHYYDGHTSYCTGSITDIDDVSVFITCKKLFRNANKRRNKVRVILVDAWKLRLYVDQKNLFITKENRGMDISKAIEKVRLKYGFNSIQTADVLHALNHN